MNLLVKSKSPTMLGGRWAFVRIARVVFCVIKITQSFTRVNRPFELTRGDM